MKVIPVASPHAMQTPQTSNQTDSRARAMAAFDKAAAQGTAGVNPNAISPEELGAIKPKEQLTEIAEQATEIAAQGDNSTPNVDATADTQSQQSTPEAEKPQQDPALSRQFAQLARQEKVLRAKVQQQEAAIKAREAVIAEREAKAQATESQYKQGYISRDQLRANTLAALADAGISYDEITQQILNQQTTDPRMTAELNALKNEIKELRAQNEASAKTYQEQQENSYKAAINQIKSDAKKLVYTDPAYETIKATNSTNDVVELIERTFKETGEVMTVDEAANEVEEYLVERLSKIASSTTKIKQRLSQAQASAPKDSKQTQPPAAKSQPQPMKTLTNATSTTRKLSPKERAILAFKGELKS